jgi:hypothetical protein
VREEEEEMRGKKERWKWQREKRGRSKWESKKKENETGYFSKVRDSGLLIEVFLKYEIIDDQLKNYYFLNFSRLFCL